MSFFTHCVAFGVHPRLKSRHVAWDTSAVRGTGRIAKAHLRGLYATGSPAAFVASRAAGGSLDEGARDEPVANSKCGVQVESVVSGMWGEERSGGSWEGEGVGNRGTCGDFVGGQRPATCGGEGDHGGRARCKGYLDGKLNKHASGHPAVAEGGGSAGPYLVASQNRRAGREQLILVWVQGPRGWTQRQVRDLGDLKLAVTDLWGAMEDGWWLLRGGGGVLDTGRPGLGQGDHVHVQFRGLGGGGDDEAGQVGEQGAA